jgi:hypothetical protein
MTQTEIVYVTGSKNQANDIKDIVKDFADRTKPLEKSIYVLVDKRIKAMFCTCYIRANTLVELSTIDVPLDPENQPDYRANRAIVEDDSAYDLMKQDAQKGRTFCDIVVEYTEEFDPDHPIKIIGGQHRYEAIRLALEGGVNEYHGLKVYFGLDTDQRFDVQRISNTNIDVSPDLIDRMYETVSGPQLRDWCQEVGLLEENQDFSCKRQIGRAITVRDARIFILNFFKGKAIDPKQFNDVTTTPVMVRNGIQDPEWENLKSDNPKLWDDPNLKQAGKEFTLLAQAQRKFFEGSGKTTSKDYSEKAFTHAILSSWAYVSGILQSNKVRLKKHYDLRKKTGKDPLNAEVLVKGKHPTDPPNYRGLSTRNDAKERGRCVELFFLQTEKGDGIKKTLVDLAIKKYHAKKAILEVKEAEARV